MNKAVQERAKLKAELKDFDKWASHRAGTKRYNPRALWIREYPEWDALASAFIQFLSDTSASDTIHTRPPEAACL
jgi:hypothetical protein